MATNYRGGLKAPFLRKYCRELRRRATPSERRLWMLLKTPRFENFKFRRQHQFGRLILDFFSARERLAIELDGPPHETRIGKERDQARDVLLAMEGVRVLRFTNEELAKETEKVLEQISAALNA